MRICILGGGWYGCHIAAALVEDGYEVEIRETADRLFAGASGANPARLHLGFHYPRSKATRDLSRANQARFLQAYGRFTRGVPVNLYAVAETESLVDFRQYRATLGPEVMFLDVQHPPEFGLAHVEGALQTGERHILVNRVREYFEEYFSARSVEIRYGVETTPPPPSALTVALNAFPGGLTTVRTPDWTIDCTFAAVDPTGIERYEPCVTYVYEGSWDKAVTVMDGPFPSFYPHFEPGTVSLTSARFTPMGRFESYGTALNVLNAATPDALARRRAKIEDQIRHYYPAFLDEYRHVGELLAIRAMPASGADSRLYRLHRDGRTIRVRAGKIDAVCAAADDVREMLSAEEA